MFEETEEAMQLHKSWSIFDQLGIILQFDPCFSDSFFSAGCIQSYSLDAGATFVRSERLTFNLQDYGEWAH